MKKFMRLIVMAAITLQLSVSFGYAYDVNEQRTIQIYERISPCIVSIDAQLPTGISSGTGCIISTNGGILTSSHVISNSNDIDVTLNSGKTYKAKIVSKVDNDLALLKIVPQERLNTINLGNSTNVKVGQKVLAIGNPFGFSGTLTEGIVSRIDYTKNKIQTDAAINPGNSGGPILNSNGEVIGISQSIYNPDNNKSNVGIGFAVPIDSVKEFIKLAKISKKI
ncbi:trypsin-like peptidase domain-containing protein [bacterium]|nr:trypsin-like peptidase domain-containing protein [bacterium]